ncbi:hypothetical protein J008_07082 [Cryptococcus neoformans]|nr:hypothetical protein C362_07052 [Cryptococcus neoformans var. grubii Bt1]OXG09740.1 hypothetical protein C367_07050 [Cryptococcus neoformans var. grubii Ze90-1]OXH20837.1 hypothetical protein J008_07082 [Cryptococcus neoformans var. grubii]
MTLLSAYDTTSLYPSFVTPSPTQSCFQGGNIGNSKSSHFNSMSSGSTTATRKPRKNKLPLAKIFKSKSLLSNTCSQTLFSTAGKSLIDERNNLRALEKQRKDLLTSLGGIYGMDYRSAKFSFMNERQATAEANGQRDMRKRWDNKVTNRELVGEWVDSTEESRKGWEDEVWDVMRMRIEEETKKASGASLVVRSDVEELENRLRKVMPSWEAGMSIGNTLRTVTSGHSISRQSTAEGHLEPPFSPITSKRGSNSNGSFSDDFFFDSLSGLPTNGPDASSFQSIESGSRYRRSATSEGSVSWA